MPVCFLIPKSSSLFPYFLLLQSLYLPFKFLIFYHSSEILSCLFSSGGSNSLHRFPYIGLPEQVCTESDPFRTNLVNRICGAGFSVPSQIISIFGLRRVATLAFDL